MIFSAGLLIGLGVTGLVNAQSTDATVSPGAAVARVYLPPEKIDTSFVEKNNTNQQLKLAEWKVGIDQVVPAVTVDTLGLTELFSDHAQATVGRDVCIFYVKQMGNSPFHNHQLKFTCYSDISSAPTVQQDLTSYINPAVGYFVSGVALEYYGGVVHAAVATISGSGTSKVRNIWYLRRINNVWTPNPTAQNMSLGTGVAEFGKGLRLMVRSNQTALIVYPEKVPTSQYFVKGIVNNFITPSAPITLSPPSGYQMWITSRDTPQYDRYKTFNAFHNDIAGSDLNGSTIVTSSIGNTSGLYPAVQFYSNPQGNTNMNHQPLAGMLPNVMAPWGHAVAKDNSSARAIFASVLGGINQGAAIQYGAKDLYFDTARNISTPTPWNLSTQVRLEGTTATDEYYNSPEILSYSGSNYIGCIFIKVNAPYATVRVYSQQLGWTPAKVLHTAPNIEVYRLRMTVRD